MKLNLSFGWGDQKAFDFWVKAKRVGPFAIHPLYEVLEGKVVRSPAGRFVITHIKTGFCVTNCPDKKTADRVARLLPSVVPDRSWDFEDPAVLKDWTKVELAAVRSLLREAGCGLD